MSLRWTKTKKTVRVKGTPGVYYVAKLVHKGTITEKDLVHDVSNALSIEAAEANLLLDELGNQIVRAALLGESVKVEGLGIFTPSIKAKSVATADDVTADNIQNLKINFRMDSILEDKMKNAKLEQVKK